MSNNDTIINENLEEKQDLPCFKTTSIAKILTLSILSGGFYDLILAYNYWKTLRDKFGEKVSPFWRAVFYAFTNFKLFPKLQKYFDKFGVKPVGKALAASYFICAAIGANIDRKIMKLEQTDWILEIMSLVFVIACTLIFVNIQNKINKINEQHFPNAPKNSWSIVNTVWTIILVVITIYSYLP